MRHLLALLLITVGQTAAAEAIFDLCMEQHGQIDGYIAAAEAEGWVPTTDDTRETAAETLAEIYASFIIIPRPFEEAEDALSYIETSRGYAEGLQQVGPVLTRGDQALSIELLESGENARVLTCIFAGNLIDEVETELSTNAEVVRDRFAMTYVRTVPSAPANAELSLDFARIEAPVTALPYFTGRSGIILRHDFPAPE